MPVVCAINCDHVSLAQKSRIGATITELRAELWPEVERALLVACGFRE
jgi:mRNA interferase MazF